MVLEIATRWQAAVNTEHLLRMAFCWAETRREEKKKIVRVSWETLCYLLTVNTHGTQNIKTVTPLPECTFFQSYQMCYKNITAISYIL